MSWTAATANFPSAHERGDHHRPADYKRDSREGLAGERPVERGAQQSFSHRRSPPRGERIPPRSLFCARVARTGVSEKRAAVAIRQPGRWRSCRGRGAWQRVATSSCRGRNEGHHGKYPDGRRARSLREKATRARRDRRPGASHDGDGMFPLSLADHTVQSGVAPGETRGRRPRTTV